MWAAAGAAAGAAVRAAATAPTEAYDDGSGDGGRSGGSGGVRDDFGRRGSGARSSGAQDTCLIFNTTRTGAMARRELLMLIATST